ncbi:MAG: ATP synthase F1 subunit delta [Bacteroides sp.]|nr:MAG: ATP synthase F1 subunit delta [Bacteroides sp.]
MKSIIANRYANSLLKLAIEEDKLHQTHQKAIILYDLLSNNFSLKKAITNPYIGVYKKIDIIKSIFYYKNNCLILNLIKFMLLKHRYEYIAMTIKKFIIAYNNYKGIKNINCTLSFNISYQKNYNKIYSLINSKFSQKNNLTFKIDNNIIGGIIIDIDNKRYDFSIKKQFDIIESLIKK